MNRRKFIQLGALGAGATFAGVQPLLQRTVHQFAPPANPPATVAMPISVAPLIQRDLGCDVR